MDRILATYPAIEDGDLMLCREHGAAYQKDRTNIIDYGADYYSKCCSYDGHEIEQKINAGRIALVNRYVGGCAVLDVGIGSGMFLKKRANTFGYDVNPVAISWLRQSGLWRTLGEHQFAGYTMFDVVEHLEDPGTYFRHIRLGAFLFVSIPIFKSLDVIRDSRHYRPGEHLQHFTEYGFVSWMAAYGFNQIEQRTFEIDAGRDSIHSYAFKRFAHPIYERGGHREQLPN